MKNCKWLENFANDEYKKMKKTASKKKIAEQIIVDCSDYPNAKVGSLVDYKSGRYKVVDTDFHDINGPGVVIEKIAEGEDIDMNNVPTDGGTVEASINDNECDGADCEDMNCGDEPTFEKLRHLFDKKEVKAAVDSLMDESYPSTVEQPGGVKPAPSDANIGPGRKNVTDAPYHPTFDPGEKYAMDVPDTFEEAAERTARTIDAEDSIDRTTVEGRYTWNQSLNDILNSVSEDNEGVEDVAEEELPTEDEKIEDELLEDIPEDNDIEEELPEEDSEKEEELPEEDSEDNFEEVDLPEEDEAKEEDSEEEELPEEDEVDKAVDELIK